jgi:hypothetical protein
MIRSWILVCALVLSLALFGTFAFFTPALTVLLIRVSSWHHGAALIPFFFLMITGSSVKRRKGLRTRPSVSQYLMLK